MYCEECQKAIANVHIIQIVNDKRVDINLCEECAAKKHLGGLSNKNFSLPNLLGSIFGNPYNLQYVSPTNKVKSCPLCGQSFTDITKTGRLGCSECYSIFEEELEPSLRRVQGSTQHIGKIPLRNGEKVLLRKQIQQLKNSLQEALAEEKYEKAAEIRDQIKEKESFLD